MGFGEWAIDEALFYKIREILPDNSTLIELGSGDGTSELVKHYEVYSVEHDLTWVGKEQKSNYIYAPLKEHKPIGNYVKGNNNFWYDPSIMKNKIPTIRHDLVLVDGPPGHFRSGIIKYLSLFNSKAIYIVDDLNRQFDMKIMIGIATRLKKPFTVYNAGTGGKLFGVIK